VQGSALANSPGAQLVEAAAAKRADSKAFAELLLPHVPLILEKSTSASDTDCCLNVLCHVVAAAEPASASLKLALQFCGVLAADTARDGARIAAMLELFNTVAHAEAKLEVLRRALAYAKATKCVNLAPSLHGKAEAWEREWQLRCGAASASLRRWLHSRHGAAAGAVLPRHV
jgi:hypothetical protein